MTRPRICFAILAHNDLPGLADMVANLRAAAPGEDVVVYNGGAGFDPGGLDVDVCPTSRPLRYSGTARFHAEVMAWLAGRAHLPEYVVTLEPDMMLARRGFADFLDRTMGDAGYLGTRFHQVRPGWWDNPIGRRARWKWAEGWQELIGTPGPYHSFNPGQVFRREYVEKLAAHPGLDQIIRRAEASRLRAIDEVIYPSLAVGLRCRPMSNPGSRAITLRWYPPRQLADFLADESVFLVHRVSTDLAAADRRMVHDAVAGRLRPPADYDARHVPSGPWSQVKLHTERFFRRRYLDVRTALLPEVPRRAAAQLRAASQAEIRSR
ncbi:MAG TPA: hypothetical protein VGP26_19095 [Actinophytocola sp.]|jgi:hypothetical protein|nr:hypothetical protein [Actinophytocola sp.]